MANQAFSETFRQFWATFDFLTILNLLPILGIWGNFAPLGPLRPIFATVDFLGYLAPFQVRCCLRINGYIPRFGTNSRRKIDGTEKPMRQKWH